MTSQPEPASLAVILYPSSEYHDDVICLGPSWSESTTNLFYHLMTAAFWDKRRDEGQHAAVHQQAKYFISGNVNANVAPSVAYEDEDESLSASELYCDFCSSLPLSNGGALSSIEESDDDTDDSDYMSSDFSDSSGGGSDSEDSTNDSQAKRRCC